MPRVTSTLTFVLLTSSIGSAQTIPAYELQGFEFRQKSGCINDPVNQVVYRWVLRSKNSSVEQKTARDSIGVQNPGVGLSKFIATAQGNTVIAVVKKTIRCGQWNGPPKVVDSYRFYSAPDRATLMRRVEKELSASKDVLRFEVIEWIEAPTGAPKGAFKRIGSIGVRG